MLGGGYKFNDNGDGRIWNYYSAIKKLKWFQYFFAFTCKRGILPFFKLFNIFLYIAPPYRSQKPKTGRNRKAL